MNWNLIVFALNLYIFKKVLSTIKLTTPLEKISFAGDVYLNVGKNTKR